MAYRLEKEPTGKQAIVIDGWEKGIAPSPHKGIAAIKNANIMTDMGTVVCNYTRVQQSVAAYSSTITSNGDGIHFTWNSVNTPYVNQTIVATDNNITGFTSGTAYWIAGVVGTTITLSASYGSAVLNGFGAAGTAGFTVSAPGIGVESATETYYDGSTLQYRFFFADTKNVWMQDTALSATLWYRVTTDTIGKRTSNATGFAVLNGWIHFFQKGIIYTLPTYNLTAAWSNCAINLSLQSPSVGYTNSNYALVGHQNTLNFCNGNVISTIFPDSTSAGLNPNVFSNGTYTVVGAGTYTATAPPNAPDVTLTLTAPWAFQDGNYEITFSNGDKRTSAAFSQGSTTVTWTGALSGLSTTTLIVKSYILQMNLLYAGQYVIRGQTWYPTTGGTLPVGLSANTLYYVATNADTHGVYDTTLCQFSIKTAGDGTSALALGPVLSGTQYFNSYNPAMGTIDGSVSGGGSTYVGTTSACTLSEGELTLALAELGNSLIIGTRGNTLYQWDEVSPGATGFIPLAESYTSFLLTVNNVVFAFVGQKGNVYVTNGSAASGVLGIPDYLAGIPGNKSSYIEPYFTWGQAIYANGLVLFSIQDQNSGKAGALGGIYSFVPSFYNSVTGEDNGTALRLENFNSYGTYNGLATVLLANPSQGAAGIQYWSLWTSSITSPTYGIDYTGTVPYSGGQTVIETDIVPVGTMLNKATFSQVEYKLSAPLATGESVAVSWRPDSTSAFQSLGTAVTEGANALSGYFTTTGAGMQGLQWLQLQITLTSTSSSPSFVQLREVRVRQ